MVDKRVGDHEGGPAFHQLLQGFLHQAFIFGIQRTGGFIQDQDSRVFQDRTGDGNTLPLSAG